MEKAIKRYWPVFVLPTLIAFIIGFVWPFIWGTGLSFCKFTTVKNVQFAGLSNYKMIWIDDTFTHAFWFTAVFTIVSTVLINVLAFSIALLLTRGMRGTNAGVEESADAAGARMGHLASERRQHALDIGNSLRKIEIELRNAMEIAAIATEFLELGHRESLREAHLLQLIVIQDCGTHVSSILLHFLNVIYEYSCLVKCNVIGSLPLDRGAGTKSHGRVGRL